MLNKNRSTSPEQLTMHHLIDLLIVIVVALALAALGAFMI